ncbi:MAG: hypothetical protein LBN25_00120 [Christensenellaceae bacterium]|jgi:Zn finger protein HypA/HybF involved in hydrogenase expression|nr:hypothetical protein [Christensenellaceae bacterium]
MADDFDEIFEEKQPEGVDIATEKCPSCGASLEFNPDKGVLYCTHCSTEVPFSSSKSNENALDDLFNVAPQWSAETKTFTCPNCGAKEIVGKDEIAKTCAFCGTPFVVEKSEISGMKPQAVVPFKFGTEKAIVKVKEWAKKKFYAPKTFKNDLTTENVRGLYQPAYTFDSHTQTSYYGRLYRNETYTVKQGKNYVTKTRRVYFNISGNYSHFFDDMLIYASDTIPQKTVSKLEPFGTNNSEKYNDSFLHGYSATQYKLQGQTAWSMAKNKMETAIERAILSRYTYSGVSYFHKKVHHNAPSYKYLLLPIYIGHFNFQQKLYNFFINGETGKITGKYPKSPLKVLATVGIALAIIILLGILAVNYGGN